MAINRYRYSGEAPLEDRGSLHWSDLRPVDEPAILQRGLGGELLVQDYLTAGDYSSGDGGIVRSNVDAFSEEYAETRAVLWWPLSGAYGSFGIAVNAAVEEYAEDPDHPLHDQASAIIETLNGLESYPLMDEDLHSQQQSDREYEAFDDAAVDAVFLPRLTALLCLAGCNVDPSAGSSGITARMACEELIGDDGTEVPPRWQKLLLKHPTRQDERELTGWFEEATGSDSLSNNYLRDLYYALADQFSVYPEVEGSGDNLNANFYIDRWLSAFSAALDNGYEALSEYGERLVLDDGQAGDSANTLMGISLGPLAYAVTQAPVQAEFEHSIRFIENAHHLRPDVLGVAMDAALERGISLSDFADLFSHRNGLDALKRA